MKSVFLSIPAQFIRHESHVLAILTCFVGVSLITSCSSSENSSASYLPAELQKAVQQEAAQFFITTGFEPLHLDTVIELTIHDVRHPTAEPYVHPGLADKELWCFTIVAHGTVKDTPHEVSHPWFGLKEEDGWVVIPRHIVAYMASWDDACDQAERLDA